MPAVAAVDDLVFAVVVVVIGDLLVRERGLDDVLVSAAMICFGWVCLILGEWVSVIGVLEKRSWI